MPWFRCALFFLVLNYDGIILFMVILGFVLVSCGCVLVDLFFLWLLLFRVMFFSLRRTCFVSSTLGF